MSPKAPSFSKILIIILSVILFYGAILLAFDFEKIILAFNKIDPLRYLLIFPITGLTLLVQGWRYKLTLEKLDISLNFKESFLVYAAGLSMTLTPGGAGSIIKSYILKIKTGRSFSSTSPIIIYEKWLELVAIVTIIGILLIQVNILESQIVFIIGICLSGFILFAFKNTLGIDLLNNLLEKIKFLNGYKVDTEEFRNTTIKLTQAKTLVQLLSITFLSKILPMIAVFYVFNLFDGNFDIFTTSQIYFTSLVAGLLTFIPGGIVVTEAGLLGLSMKFGIDFATAAVLVILVRLLTFWFPTFVGFAALKSLSSKTD